MSPAEQFPSAPAREKTSPERHAGGNGHNGTSAMHRLAVEEIRHYTAPLPEAEMPPANAFPRQIWWGLGGGVILGGLLGVIFGVLLLRNQVIIPGWEGLYSMAPGAFIAFWLFAGSAVGILVGGVGAILTAHD